MAEERIGLHELPFAEYKVLCHGHAPLSGDERLVADLMKACYAQAHHDGSTAEREAARQQVRDARDAVMAALRGAR